MYEALVDAGGSIPACAGKPPAVPRRHPTTGVYPRVCGEAPTRRSDTPRRTGLSPRVRGSPLPKPNRQAGLGSIPACAGKPSGWPSTQRAPWVYPRVCGEARLEIHLGGLHRGLSPRVRGSRCGRSRPVTHSGSIPACAGKPRSTPGRRPSTRVYPRVCGEAADLIDAVDDAVGLSPRVRGSLIGAPIHRPVSGSIPACHRIRPGSPRCGEALSVACISPRVRGSLCQIIDRIQSRFNCQ